jgi:hypothetical protein
VAIALVAVFVIGGVSSAASAGPTWSKSETLGPTGRESGEPQIAVTPAGEALAVWEGGRPSGIQVSSHAPGRDWSRPVGFPTFNQGQPQIAATGRKAVVVWSGAPRGHPSQGGASVFAATRLTGKSWSKPRNLSADKRWLYEPEGEDPQVAITPQGEAVAMWTASDEGHSTASFIRAAAQPLHGGWTSSVGIRGSIEGEEPRLAVGPDGEAVALWHAYYNEESGMEVASRPAGEKWSAVRLSNPGAFPQLQIATTPSGEAVAAWEVEGEGAWAERLVQVATRKPGSPWRVRTFAPLEAELIEAPQVVIEPDGRAAVVWLRSTLTEEKEYVAATHSPGGHWTEPQSLFEVDFEGEAEFAVTGSGEWIALWRAAGAGPRQSLIQVSSKPRNQAWSGPVTLSGVPGARISQASEPRLAVAPGGAAFAIWRAYNGNRWVVEAATRRR